MKKKEEKKYILILIPFMTWLNTAERLTGIHYM